MCLLVIDATEGATDQDEHIAGYVLETMRGLAIVATKWDLMPDDVQSARAFEDALRFRLRFVPHAPLLRVSALTGENLHNIVPTAVEVYEHTRLQIPTSRLNKFLLEWAARRQPVSKRGSARLKYATQVGTNPPTFRLFFSGSARVHRTYLRYLENGLREEFDLSGAPVRMVAAGNGGT